MARRSIACRECGGSGIHVLGYGACDYELWCCGGRREVPCPPCSGTGRYTPTRRRSLALPFTARRSAIIAQDSARRAVLRMIKQHAQYGAPVATLLPREAVRVQLELAHAAEKRRLAGPVLP